VALKHVVDRVGGHVTIVLAGDADLASKDQLRRVLFDAVAERPTRVTVDLRGLVFIDSQSIGTLVAARRSAVENGATFRVTNPRGQVLHVLRMAGMLTALTRADPDGAVGGGATSSCA
jgi:anti-sigma B factor antagonist